MEFINISAKEICAIKNFSYPVACTGMCISPDTRRLITTGIYSPSIRFYDLDNMTLRFDRHMVTDPLKISALTDDGEKFAVLRNDKTVEMHMPSGLHDMVKMPYQPKDMLLNKHTAELYLSGEYSEVYRFNLEQGRFLKGLDAPGLLKMAISQSTGIVIGMQESGLVFIDPRAKASFHSLAIDNAILSAVDYSTEGTEYCIGTEEGILKKYDIRSEGHISEYSLGEGDKIEKIKYNGNKVMASHGNVLSALQNEDTSKIVMEYKINDFDAAQGILFVGGEDEEMKCLVSRDLGEFPSYCSNFIL
ncbi:ribosome biogenesis protein ENP2 [Enteropsectra breve]|nr:ribosome biogenesis protein ENP2 [Enteropsectra breve]